MTLSLSQNDKLLRSIFIFILVSTHLKCVAPDVKDSIPYELANPTQVHKLAKELKEISGLAWWGGDTLLAIQDEKGILFFLSANDGEVLKTIEFAGDGDYEGVAVTYGTVYVLRSDGDIYRLKELKGKKADTEKIETALSRDNDTEGFCFDRHTKSLLIACKEKPGGDFKKQFKTIYSFPIDSEDILSDPFLVINEDSLLHQLHKKYENKIGAQFKPSGMSIHPLTGELDILSGSNGLLAVFDSGYQLQEVIRFKKSILPQAEGICFSPTGRLYISSEGDKGVLAQFEMNREP